MDEMSACRTFAKCLSAEQRVARSKHPTNTQAKPPLKHLTPNTLRQFINILRNRKYPNAT